jgi:cation diffusion facilitator CzcD-associated flavoprotein CzcO
VPSVVADSLPRHVFAHTCQDIDFASLRGKRVAILGGGASAFDNAQYALEAGVGEVHVFVRRAELPRVNPIRKMEQAGENQFYTLYARAATLLVAVAGQSCSIAGARR